MKLLRFLTLFIATFALVGVAQANVFQVNGIETKFKKFNSQKIRSYAVDVATKRGFEKLLNNIVSPEYNIKELMETIDLKKTDVVEKLNIVNEVNVKGDYHATFDILYNKEKVKKILQERRVPYTQEAMGEVLLLPIQQNAKQEYLLFEESNQFKQMLFEQLENSLLISPILAKGDLQEITTYNPQNILDENNPANLENLTARYNTNKALIILLQQNNYQGQNLYQVTLKFFNIADLKEESFIVLGKDLQQVSKEIAEKIKTIWREKNTLEFNKPKRFVAMVQTVGNLDKLYSVINKIEKLNIVSSVKIKTLTTQYAFIQTDFYGQPNEFLTATKNADLNIFQSGNGQWVIQGEQN